ncbi:MAG: Pilin domain protein [Candidatus Beckwithbacteria bacterium GW2011_GWC2_49_11]|nr:MAG: Pilin domain protein [Candidatus Beckwithbacteria bacterium GW2011_GWC2_49_11]
MKKGFTLIELLVSITIIGILASIGLGTFQNSQKKSRDTRRKNDLKQVSLALEAYLNDKGQYPGDNSDSGQIYGCGADDESLCDWGDEFTDQYGTVYMVEIPADPTLGYTYDYDADDMCPKTPTVIRNPTKAFTATPPPAYNVITVHQVATPRPVPAEPWLQNEKGLHSYRTLSGHGHHRGASHLSFG